VKSVGCAELNLRQAEEKVLGAAVHVASQLDALVRTTVETFDNGVLHAARNLPRERALTQTTR